MVALTIEQEKAAEYLATMAVDERDFSGYPADVQKSMKDYIEWLEDSANDSTDNILMERIFG